MTCFLFSKNGSITRAVTSDGFFSFGMFSSLLAVCFVCGSVCAQETNDSSKKESKTLREIRIDANALSQVLDEKWETVLREDYLEWKSSLRRFRHAPSKTSIEKAFYYAEIGGEKITNGGVTYEIRNRSSAATNLPLDPLNLHLYDLEVDSRKAIWGSGTDRKTSLLAPPGPTSVTGRWTHSGERLFPNIARKVFRYRFELPQANSSSFSISLPRGWSLKSDSGIVREPSANDLAKRSLWKIDLGRASECVVTVMSENSATRKNPVLFAESDTTYLFSREGLEFRHRVQLEILEKPTRALSFLIPEGFSIASVRLGNDKNLLFETPDPGNPRLLRIPFRHAKQGNLGPLTLTGYANYPLNRYWSLPEIRLQNAVVNNARIHLLIEDRILLQNLRHRGFRQTDFRTVGVNQTRRSYRKILPEAKLDLFFTRPPVLSQVDLFTRYNIQPDELRFESLVRWSAKNGAAFNLIWSLPKQWDVVAVEWEDRDNHFSPANWFYGDGFDSSTRSLQIDVGRAVAPNDAVLLRLTCRKTIKDGEIPIDLRFAKPENADVLQHAIGISTNPTLRYRLNKKSSWREISSNNIPDRFQSLPGVHDFLTAHRALDVSFYLAKGKQVLGTLGIRRSESNYRASAEIHIRREVDRLTERCQLFIEPTDQAVQTVVVYSPRKSHGYSWQFHDPQSETPVDLQVAILDPSQHARWNVPVAGALMELRLPVATKKPFGLVGTISRTASLVETPSLVFLPSALDFRGSIRIEADSKLRIQPMTSLLQLSRTAIPNTSKQETEKSFQTVGSWKYSDPSEELSINVLNPGQKIALSATLFLETKISASDAYHIHTAEYLLNPSIFSGAFEFQLDSESELLSLELNGRPVRFSRNTKQIQLPSLPVNRQNTVRILYRQPARIIRWKQKLAIPLPIVSANLLGMRWKLVLPTGVQLCGMPDSFQCEEMPVSHSWLSRFFGPLQIKNSVEPNSHPLASHSHRQTFAASSPQDGTVTTMLVSAFVPQELTVSLQSQSSETSILWGLLFLGSIFCIFTRFAISSTRSRALLMGIIFLGFATTIVLPESSASYSGSILFGVVLSLLVRVDPRSEKKDRSESNSQFTDEFSGFRLKTPVRLTGLLFLLALLSGSLGAIGSSPPQDPVSDWQASTPKNEEIVLVPFVESGGKETPLDVVYMRKTLEQRLSRDLNKSHQQKYYIASANYRGISKTENAIKTVANLKVFVPQSTDHVEISLPFAGVVLEGENSCLVNGKPNSLRRSRTGRGYILDFLDVGKQTQKESAISKLQPSQLKEIAIELRFRIPIRQDMASGHIDIGLPPIADSTMSMEFARTYDNLKMSFDGRIVPLEMQGHTFSVKFGPATRLSLFWNEKNGAIPKKKPIPFDRNTVVDLSPGSIQVANSLKIDKLTQPISFLVLRIPSPAIFRHLKANSLKSYYTLYSQGDAKFIAVEFQKPQSSIDDFVWNYEIPRNTSSKQSTTITIPASISRNPLQGNFLKRQHVLGLTSSLEYELHIPNRPPNSWGVLQPDNALANALKFLSPVTPAALYRVEEPATLHCTLSSRKNVQEFFQKQSFQFQRSEVLWTLEANLRPSGQRNFRYSLKIDPRLEIESVSVLKDSVERLAQWNRHKDRINLILKESLSAPQQILIRGKIPFHLNQPFHFSKIVWDDLTVTDSVIEISHSRNLLVDLQNSQIPARLEGISPADANSEFFYWGSLRSNPGDKKLSISFVELKDAIQSEIVTFIDSVSTTKMRIRNILRLRGLKDLKRDFAIPIPESFAGNTKPGSEGVEATARISETGERFLLIRQENFGDDSTVVSMVSEIDRPIERKWNLPLLQIEGIPFTKRYLALDKGIFRPGKKNSFIFRDSAPPRWVESFLSPDEKNARLFSYQTSLQSLVLDDIEKNSPASVKIAIPLAELSLWTNSQPTEQGSLRLHLLTNEAKSLSLFVPKSIRPHTLLVNRRQIPIAASEESVQAIPLDSSLDRQLVEIFWQKKRTSPLSFLGSIHHEIPFPLGIPVERTLTNVALPQGYRTFSLRGASELKRPERFLQRLEGYAEMGYFRRRSFGYEEFESTMGELNELFASAPSLQQDTNHWRERFHKIVAQTEANGTTKKRKQKAATQNSLFHGQFDRISRLKNDSGSGFHASLENRSKTQFVEYRLWNDTASRWLSFAVSLLLAVPFGIWISRTRWFHRLTMPLYFRTCLLGAVGLIYWQWEWLGVAMLLLGMIQLAFREKLRRQSVMRIEQSALNSTANASTVSY